MDREMVVDNGDIVNNDDLIGEINQVKSQLKLITNVGVGNEIQLLNVLIEDIDKRQRICVVALLCHIVRALHMLEIILPRHARNPTSRDHYEKERRRVQLMTHLVQTERCRDITRMSPATFMKLCEKLRSTGIVKDSTKATIEEKVAKFLHIVGHNVKNRTVSFFFHRSGETVSQVPPEILHNPRFFPYFKDCIGAIDGTHSRVKVRRADAPRFRGRKDVVLLLWLSYQQIVVAEKLLHCSKISLTGKLKLVDEKSKEGEFARNALFSKHSEMKDWPSDHDFQVFKLEIENIFLIDWFGGPKPLTVEEYLHPKVNNHGFILRMLF
ncbi:putative nuclease HARBI1 [Trifolium repens]|nr:putative nuclease HARBI1 [Trifolium repens]